MIIPVFTAVDDVTVKTNEEVEGNLVPVPKFHYSIMGNYKVLCIIYN